MFLTFANIVGFAGQDLSKWDMSSVTSTQNMFEGTVGWNGDVSKWDTSSIKRMGKMFASTTFDGDLSAWDVKNVEDFTYMFESNAQFTGVANTAASVDSSSSSSHPYPTGGLTQWETSSATTMKGMFAGAESFQGNLEYFDVSKVADFSFMLAGTESFQGQGLGKWNTGSATNMASM